MSQAHLKYKDYPLPLDVALPTFQWYVWFRNEHYQSIVYLSEPEEFKTNLAQIEQTNKYRVTKDTVVGDNYFRNGDVLRWESVTLEDLNSAKEVIKPILKEETGIIYFNAENKVYNKLIKNEKNNLYTWPNS